MISKKRVYGASHPIPNGVTLPRIEPAATNHDFEEKVIIPSYYSLKKAMQRLSRDHQWNERDGTTNDQHCDTYIDFTLYLYTLGS